jgi:16S rRNA (guanine1516-N2)-methyltransferase
MDVSVAPDPSGNVPESAQLYGVAIATSAAPDAWQLVRRGARWALRAPASAGGYLVCTDSSDPAVARRLATARRTDPLPRAVGMHRRKVPHVVDATAGLGRDALVLARLGCSVTALERVPALCVLLQEAAAACGAEFDVVCVDASAWLRAQEHAAARPAVVYLDPMFSEAGKAQVKKEMQACRALAGAPRDNASLFAAARGVATERVVVKRHPQHRPLADDVSFEVRGDRVRFDVYLTS